MPCSNVRSCFHHCIMHQHQLVIDAVRSLLLLEKAWSAQHVDADGEVNSPFSPEGHNLARARRRPR